MPKAKQQRIYIAVYEHRHGVDLWPVVVNTPADLPPIEEAFAEYEPEREDEYVEWRGPFPVAVLGVKDAKS